MNSWRGVPCTFNFWTKIAEATGDGNNDPDYQSNLVIYTRHVLEGDMPSAENMGLLNIINTADPYHREITFTMNLGTNRNFSHGAIVESISPMVDADGHTVNVRFTLVKAIAGTALTEN